MKKSILLKNNQEMPFLIQGLPLICGCEGVKRNSFLDCLSASFNMGVRALDTSHDYGKSEEYIGYVLQNIKSVGLIREDVFITTKIGNSQQYEGNIEKYVDKALKTMKLDYLDAMLLHWPVPNHFVENWQKLVEVYKKGKIKSIGIANALPRHFEQIKKSGTDVMPHILQTEIHPFNTCEDTIKYCRENGIALQACSSLCMMMPRFRNNIVLQDIAKQYDKTLPQIVLRWHIQKGIAPIFRSYNEKHIQESADIWHFKLSNEDMKKIDLLNEDYRYHPESSNCAGF